MGNPTSQADVIEEAKRSKVANHQVQIEVLKALDLGSWDVRFSLFSVPWRLSMKWLIWMLNPIDQRGAGEIQEE